MDRVDSIELIIIPKLSGSYALFIVNVFNALRLIVFRHCIMFYNPRFPVLEL